MAVPRYLEKFSEVHGGQAAAPTFIGAGTAVTGDGGTPHTFTHHASTAVGHFKLGVLYSKNVAGGSFTLVSNGWTEVYNDLSTGGLIGIWYKFHEVHDGPLVITVAGTATGAAGDTTVAQMATWSGVSRRNPFGSLGVMTSNGSAQDIGAIAGITLPALHTLVVIGGKADDWTSVAALSQSGMTFAEIGETSTTTGADAGLVWDYGTVDAGTALAVTAKTFTVTGGGAAVGKGVMLALNPGLSYTFPLKRYEYTDEQPVRTAYGAAVGASYSHDYLGSARSPKGNAKSNVRFFALETSTALLDAEIDELRSKLYEIGLGKVWTLGADATRRWAYARLEAMPEILVAVGQTVHMPTAAQFARLSDWYDESVTTVTGAITTATGYLTVTNPGNATVYNAIIRIRSSSAAGFTNPGVTNLRTGESFSSTRDAASTSDELKIDCGALTVGYSANDGASYADDMAVFTRGADQVGFMTFPPGQSTIEITCGGTPNLSLEISLWGAYS
jgi:hypothetical protein